MLIMNFKLVGLVDGKESGTSVRDGFKDFVCMIRLRSLTDTYGIFDELFKFFDRSSDWKDAR